jgi:hypothetical protein
MLPFWPGVDGWPPPLWVWIAAAILTVVVPLVIVVFGTVGVVIYVVFLVGALIRGANMRLKRMGAEEFWESRPKDD